jgi:hypothetical protein
MHSYHNMYVPLIPRTQLLETRTNTAIDFGHKGVKTRCFQYRYTGTTTALPDDKMLIAALSGLTIENKVHTEGHCLVISKLTHDVSELKLNVHELKKGKVGVNETKGKAWVPKVEARENA